MITMNHVSKEYSTTNHVIHDLNLEIEDGEFVFITGESGVGKSTFIKLLTKEIEPTSGIITVNGINLSKLKKKEVPKYRRNIGCIFQDFRLLNDRNVYENVAFAERVINTPVRKIHNKVPQMLSMVGLSSKAKTFPNNLSGGERQRVAIARALVNEASIILADEPTGNLDDLNSWEIMKLLQDVNKAGKTVIVVSHNQEIVESMNKRVITLLKYGKTQSGGR